VIVRERKRVERDPTYMASSMGSMYFWNRTSGNKSLCPFVLIITVIPQFSEKKLIFFFSFLSCSVTLGFGVLGGIPQGNSSSLGIFFRWGQELRWESEFGSLISIRWMGAPLSSPTLANPLSLSPIVTAAPPSSSPPPLQPPSTRSPTSSSL
jgi:hypothetical protein